MTQGGESKNKSADKNRTANKKCGFCKLLRDAWVSVKARVNRVVNGLNKFDGLITAIATALLVIVTIILAMIAYWQGKILDRTDETSRLRDRAFVYFGDPGFVPYPPENVIVHGVTIFVNNAGNMPARRVVVRYSCPNVLKSNGPIKDPFDSANWTTADMPQVIGPKQTFGLQTCEIPIGVITEAQKGNRDIFIITEVSYIDGFDLVHTRVTQMTRNLRFDRFGGHSLGFIGPHNCSDDDCPKQQYNGKPQ